jgi:CO/xanthine dehydrogenase FAD-binding subunit
VIPFDFTYHRPATVAEAVETYRRLADAGREPLYYGGGTEIITLARQGQLRTGAVVDLKGVPECRILAREDGWLRLGACLSLAEICERAGWPLMADVAGRVADHTTRCQITLGGNLAGQIPYREAVLPLLLTDAVAVVAGVGGLRRQPFAEVFDGVLTVRPGEFLAQVEVPLADLDAPHFAVKKTRLDWVDYPLLTIAGVRAGGRVRVAISGLCGFPFRDAGMERELEAGRVKGALGKIPGPVVDDLHGSADYRRHVLAGALDDALEVLRA